MTCVRCQGLMVTSRLEDVGGSTEFEPLSGWHCLQCGEVIDPGIEANRKDHREPRRNLARPPGTVPAGSSGPKRKERTH